ncbi:MAG: right-handed parallel beta-helix repeat-containing protein, partial [Candidatus Aenigmarchaeota archaeon]|nr:right-handed parallel beta-helix repeat-containing protein [Candidatus Aenigmarchaeota archaeon]
DDVFMMNNTISDNYIGAYFNFSENNTVVNNTVSGNKGYGIYMNSSSGSTIYNNLFNNTNNFGFSGTIYANDWNTTKQTGTRIYSYGTQIGGNYYTNSTGNGYSDTCTDSDKDGFCDNSYTLGTNNIDYLPLGGNIYVCMTLSTPDTVYTMTSNVSSDATCFTIEADNITLDCDGYMINYSQSSAGHAINNSDGYDNITIKNCNIITYSSNADHAIKASGMENSTITNNTIRILHSSGAWRHGILLASSSSNTISDNTIITYGAGDHAIRIESSSNSNNISSNILTIEGSMLAACLYIDLSDNSYISSNNLTATGTNYALWLEEADNNKIYDTFLDAYTSSDIRVEEASKNYLINCTFNQSDVTFVASPTLEIQWYLDIYVNDSSGSSLEDANITAWQ